MINKFFNIRKAAFSAAFFVLVSSMAFAVSNARTLSGGKVKREAVKKSAETIVTPDFAFPKDVEKEADNRLSLALRKKQYPEALSEMVKLIIARNLVSTESRCESMELCDSVAALLPQPYRGLADLIQAQMLSEMYADNNWMYRQRSLPLDSVPADPSLWDTAIFADKVYSLVYESSNGYSAAEALPVSILSDLIMDWEEGVKVGLSVAAYMKMMGVRCLEPFSNSVSQTDVIPFFDFKPEKGAPALFSSLLADLYKDARHSDDNLRCYLDNWLVDKGRSLGMDMTPFILYEIEAVQEDNAKIKLQYLLFANTSLSVAPSVDNYENEPADCLEAKTDMYFSQKILMRRVPSVSDFYESIKEIPVSNLDEESRKVRESMLASFSRKWSQISYETQYLPGDSLKMELTAANMTDPKVMIFKVADKYYKNNDGKTRLTIGGLAGVKPVADVKLSLEGEIPFVGKKVFSLPPLSAGVYALVVTPEEGGISALSRNVKSTTPDLFLVSDLSMQILTLSNNKNIDNDKKIVVSVCDSRTGQPVEDASVSLRSDYYVKNVETKNLPPTDANGLSEYCWRNIKNMHLRASAEKAASIAREDFYISNYRQSSNSLTTANIFTDLSVYHPGDSVGFATVIYRVTESLHKAEIVPEKGIIAILHNPAAEAIDTIRLVTDSDGRASGCFQLPKEDMRGTWSIRIKEDLPERDGSFLATQTIEMADYKAPTFLVDLQKSDSDIPLSEEACFRGSVVSYSGMPMPGCKVAYKVDYIPFRYYGGGRNASFSGETECGSDGNFSITLPTRNLKDTRFEYGRFVIRATAVSEAGESQESANLFFSLGNGLTIQPSIPETLKAPNDIVRFSVPVRDPMGRMVACDVEYVVRNYRGEEIASGAFAAPAFDIASYMLPSGQYSFSFHIKGEKHECASNGDASASTIIWRESDLITPVATPLWVPEDQVVGLPGETVSITVGNRYHSGSILCVVSCSDGTYKIERISPRGQNIKYKVKVPAADERTQVTFYGIHDLKTVSRTVTIIPQTQTENMKITASSFRERIVPGSLEKWSFMVNVGNLLSLETPALAVMSDKALDAIAPFAWHFNVNKGGWRFPINGYFPSADQRNNYNSWNNLHPYWIIMNYPELNSYGQRLAMNNRTVRLRGVRYNSEMTKGSSVEDYAVETVMMDAAPANGMMAFSERKMMASASIKEEAEDEVPVPDAGGSDVGVSQDNIPLCNIEMPLAFFKPELKTDEVGQLTLDFKVPDFNTTWKLQVCGYDKELHTALLTLDAVAAKKVMVKSNIPSFVRIGDKVSIASTLFNNSEKAIPVGGRIEVFNPLDGLIIAQSEFSPELLQIAESRTVRMDFTVNSEYMVLGIRSYAMGGDFSDGEQGLVPVLTASSPVVESEPFFLAPGQDTFTTRLPKFKDHAFVSLQYCDNPVWYCVTALPTLMDVESKSALALSRSLFGGCIAEGLVNRYPHIRSAVKEIFSSEAKDSLMISNLEKYEELKIIALSSTPWQNDASAETLRMNRLGSLIDKEKNEALKNLLVGKLLALQNKGGWKWTADFRKESRFITERVLKDFSLMKQSGVVEFDPRMKKMCDDAMAWIEKDIVYDYEKNWRRTDKYPYSSLMNYLFIRSGLTSAAPGGTFAKLRTRALEALASEWKGYDISEKATAALVLSRAGRKKDAMLILESLSQYSSSSSEKGVWFDNDASGNSSLFITARVLEAFAEIYPSSPMVDGLRQWLVLSRQTLDWGKEPYIAEVIAVILNSGSVWIDNGASQAVVKIDGKVIETPSTLAAGEFTLFLDAKKVSGKTLEISRSGVSQAWGGVAARYIQPMQDVKQSSVPDISITKEIIRIASAEDGSVSAGGALTVGDRVRVTLTIRCGKNMEYVVVTDERPASLRPVEQLSGYTISDGIGFYKEVRSSDTNLFIEYLPKGEFVVSYECFVERPGIYSNGIATAQSQYSPVFTAHSAGSMIVIPPSREK